MYALTKPITRNDLSTDPDVNVYHLWPSFHYSDGSVEQEWVRVFDGAFIVSLTATTGQ